MLIIRKINIKIDLFIISFTINITLYLISIFKFS